jgi:hypothetical protein
MGSTSTKNHKESIIHVARPANKEVIVPETLAIEQDKIPATPLNGLVLAGQPLEPPRFHPVDWKRLQRFTASADPDRTHEPWHPPTFINRDPALQRQNTSVEEIEIPGIRQGSSSFARVVRGVFTEADCVEIIRAVNVKGFTPALLNVGGGIQQLRPEYRDGFRVIVDSYPLSAWILEVIRPHLPETMQGRYLESLNERCRFLCYTPGQEFGEHHDALFTHPKTKAQSAVTVQVYLHDVPMENGGATTFLCGRNGKVPCQPEMGSALLFSQDLLHEGSLLKSGLKYTFRTEAMYELR